MTRVGDVPEFFPNPWQKAPDPDKQGNMDKDMFLRLLVTQLQYQDPMSEQQDMGDMIAQLTLFTLVEQITSLRQTMELQMGADDGTKALGMLNKEVELFDMETGEIISGEVTSVSFEGLYAYVTVNEKEYPLGTVYRVGDLEKSEEDGEQALEGETGGVEADD